MTPCFQDWNFCIFTPNVQPGMMHDRGDSGVGTLNILGHSLILEISLIYPQFINFMILKRHESTCLHAVYPPCGGKTLHFIYAYVESIALQHRAQLKINDKAEICRSIGHGEFKLPKIKL